MEVVRTLLGIDVYWRERERERERERALLVLMVDF